jgi:hypothetical protein
MIDTELRDVADLTLMASHESSQRKLINSEDYAQSTRIMVL